MGAWLARCRSSETLGRLDLGRLDLAGHSFSMYSKTPLRCRSPSGAMSALDLLLKRTLLEHSPTVNFVSGELEIWEPVLELYLTRVCASVMNGVEVYSGVN